ncbi:hypothetical protein AVEN_105787-1 [Araneus ventricosus]|uniref:Uncharacterized protein n=1 Tax=Araneus ventricosus TaxID=182803 RepID=A0A4Y2X2G0_ARAVE|nr:hypothetical protein AVEN_170981-1 [Araneus ventricosus]GBO43306.1 hypothetical protein AVEN_257865-1 [Araneus ventricosus]GBO43308.1 hypothetical protein AVEN_270947-1 [Araneus ventricosus]GBO43312.1 hypothetical protein AVEN_105787-1 [Araneus ventricosus]
MLRRHCGGLRIFVKVVQSCLIACDDPEKKVRDEEVRQAAKKFIRSLGIDFYQDGFLKLILRYDKCINVDGEYVEKKSIFYFAMSLYVYDCNKAPL